MKALIYVTLKPSVLDPQGKAVLGGLQNLGYREARDVRVGKFIEVRLEGLDRGGAESRVKEMCEKLLANTVIEQYRLEIVED
ncbi:MAG TPA: phosphoribosylformylglycinamidine synthase subunit PurS [Candidatus Polarisedimenticolia bacterium]|jgi:phosphoribosylformylglycinamidine synthase